MRHKAVLEVLYDCALVCRGCTASHYLLMEGTFLGLKMSPPTLGDHGWGHKSRFRLTDLKAGEMTPCVPYIDVSLGEESSLMRCFILLVFGFFFSFLD